MVLWGSSDCSEFSVSLSTSTYDVGYEDIYEIVVRLYLASILQYIVFQVPCQPDTLTPSR